ncbi:hypothetical protein [Lysinibacillus fusiformis]|uniref:hypothetical protein n=1 Tax=Lysinibacillus fusiformis TaxID=28031 RepID=UPI0015968313|nr:hypothetical protein [Lysinibacillus fusiformis]
MELAGVNVGRIKDTRTYGRETTTSSPKPSQNGSNSKPDEANKGRVIKLSKHKLI